MQNPEIREALIDEIIRLLDEKYSGGIKLSELLTDIICWAINNNISTKFFTNDVEEIIYSKPRNIDYVEYPWRGKPKIFVYLNSEVVVMEVIDMDTEEE
jgi:hypothetical protein